MIIKDDSLAQVLAKEIMKRYAETEYAKGAINLLNKE